MKLGGTSAAGAAGDEVFCCLLNAFLLKSAAISESLSGFEAWGCFYTKQNVI